LTTPSHERKGWTDYDIEQTIAKLLHVGVLVAAVVTVVGGIFMLIQHGGTRPDFAEFRGEPAHLTSVPGILRGAAALRSEAIVQLGILLLILTPIARVAYTVVAFAKQRDRTYVTITLFILALLLYGLLIGRA
jgi:uncharacterized membrane protein